MQRKILIGLTLTLIIVIFIPVYWATEPGRQEAASERLKMEARTRGAKIYTSNCAVCHGPAGEGKIGPKLKGTQLDENALRKNTTRGVSGKAMPAFGEEDGGPLKTHQIEDLVTFIRNWDQSLIEAPSVTTPAPAPTQASAPGVIDARLLFTGKCAACHGANRQGVSGLGNALTPGSLAKLSDTEVRNLILKGRVGTPMPAFSGVLTPEEVDALVQLIKYTSP